MRLIGLLLLLVASTASAEDAKSADPAEEPAPEIASKYDEITDLGEVGVISTLGEDECGVVLGFGVLYLTMGDPKTSKRFALKPTLVFSERKEIDAADFDHVLKSKVSVPYFIDGKRGRWPAKFTSNLEDCDLSERTCRHWFHVDVDLSKADLQRLGRAKRAKVRPFTGVDCELNATSKQVIAHFMKNAPAFK